MLSRSEILDRMENTGWNKRLIISPFLRLDTGSTAPSIDFHLGNRFTIARQRKRTKYDPLYETDNADDHVDKYFVPFGGEFILHPGQLVLAKTLEWIRLPCDLMAEVIGRSIWGRRNLLIATAVAVHPGSSGNICLELANVGNIAIVLRPGSAIGQLFFRKKDREESESYVYRSNFIGDDQPVLGKYKISETEKFYLRNLISF